MSEKDRTTTEPVTVGGRYAHNDGSSGRYYWRNGQLHGPVELEWHCAHCDDDITVAGKPDTGGDCPTCRLPLCRSCAGGWC